MTRIELPPVIEPGSDEHLCVLGRAYGMRLENHSLICAYARDVYRAGRVAGERAREALPSIRRRVESRRTFVANLAIEILASVSTLAGMRLGSTTLMGAECYLVAGLAWCAISWRKGLHGIWPLNIGALAVTLWNLWGAIA